MRENQTPDRAVLATPGEHVARSQGPLYRLGKWALVTMLIGTANFLWAQRYDEIRALVLELHAEFLTAEHATNGFNLENASVPVEAILRGGPPRDGFPALLEPQFQSAREVDWLGDADIVIGLSDGDIAKAYPFRIMVWHELVNDVLNDQPVLVSYCPLCGTAMVFDRRVEGVPRTFGVSGLLYQSDVLMYDHQTESLWSQLGNECVAGDSLGATLTWLPSKQMSWARWRELYPDSVVLSRETGHKRNYGASAYQDYAESDDVIFPVPVHRDDLPRKSWVLGVVVDDAAKAYPIDRLDAAVEIRDTIGGTDVEVRWDIAARHGTVTDADGAAIPSVQAYWFAWQAFYPDTELWGLQRSGAAVAGQQSAD